MSLKINGYDSTGFSKPLASFGFLPFDMGVIKTWRYIMGDGSRVFGFGNPLVLPNLLVLENEVHWRVPVDNIYTLIFIASSIPQDNSNDLNNMSKVINFLNEDKDYDVSNSFGQDAMALETSEFYQKEQLGRSDYGVILFRRMFRNLCKLIDNKKYDELPARPIDGLLLIRQYMGGYLPSTSLHRTENVSDDLEKWKNLMCADYKEFNVES